MAELSVDHRRTLVGADDVPGVLDEYKVMAIAPASGAPVVIWHCPRQHGAVTGHAGIIARSVDGDQTGLTLGELVRAAIDHEIEAH